MPGLTKFLGGRELNYYPFNLGGNEYEVIDFKVLLQDMFFYDVFPEEYDLKRIIIVGSQNSGKTVLIRNLVLYLMNNYDPNEINAFLTNDIRVIRLKKYRELWSKFIQIIIIDDAVKKGIDSRRFMSFDNIDFTEEYFQIRHTFEEYGRKNGIIILIIATQDYSAIDKRIRDNVQMVIYKTYYRHKWFQEELNYDNGILKFIKDATYQSLIRSNFEARSCGVGLIQTGDIFQFKNRNIRPNEVSLPLLLYESGKEELIQILIAKLMKQFDWIIKVPDRIIKGYLQYEADNHKDIYPSTDLSISNLNYIIRWGAYLQYQDMYSPPNIEIKKEMGGWDETDIIYLYDTLKLSFQKIEDEYGIPSTTANRWYKKAVKSRENRIDELINNEIVQIDS